MDVYHVICGDPKGTTSQTYDTLRKLTTQSHPDDDKLIAVTAVWLKKNPMAMGLLQGTISLAIWPDFLSHTMAKDIWDVLEAKLEKWGEHKLTSNWLT